MKLCPRRHSAISFGRLMSQRRRGETCKWHIYRVFYSILQSSAFFLAPAAPVLGSLVSDWSQPLGNSVRRIDLDDHLLPYVGRNHLLPPRREVNMSNLSTESCRIDKKGKSGRKSPRAPCRSHGGCFANARNVRPS